MNYDKIILELLDRIKSLEERINKLESADEKEETTDLVEPTIRTYNQNRSSLRTVSLTQAARDYIDEKKRAAKERGKTEIILVANDIQIALGVINRTPCICQAMYQKMGPKDEVLFAPPSGKSTTVKIKYYL